MCGFTSTLRRHEAADGRTHADDAGTATHDASPSADDDAGEAGHDAAGQIRAACRSPLSDAANRLCPVRTLGLTRGLLIVLEWILQPRFKDILFQSNVLSCKCGV